MRCVRDFGSYRKWDDLTQALDFFQGQCCREVGGATVKIPKLGAPGYLPDCGQCESTGCTVTGSCVAQGSGKYSLGLLRRLLFVLNRVKF
jgi:hypothetical protein